MDSSFPNGPVYAPTQPPDKNQSFSVSSTHMRHSVPYRPYSSSSDVTGQQVPQISHTLSSISRVEYDQVDPMTYRNLASQPSMISNHTFNATQAGSYNSYNTNSFTQINSPNSAYTQPQRSFSSPQTYNSQPSDTQPYQPYVSPHPVSGRLPDIRPMPANGLNEPSLTSPHRPSSSSTSLSLHTGQEAQPTHVVGSQGRRGILPSAVGRPAAVPIGSINCQKATNVPAKDADGKFPCPHCAKTYLHAKHLKRHLLRHTGTRPYSCGLCRDTFSRSDILKRHFQKCSVRRGNPTGENHLSHSRATKKSNLEKALGASMAQATQPERTRSMPSTQNTAVTGFATGNLSASLDISTLGITNYLEDNNSILSRESRSNSVKRPSNGGLVGNPGNFSGSSTSSYDSGNFSYSGGHVTPDSITTSGAATPYNYSNETRTNRFTLDTSFGQSAQGQGAHLAGSSRAPAGSSYPSESLPRIVGSSNGRGTDTDWPALFTANGTDEYNNTQFQSNSFQQPIKSEQDISDMSFTLQPEYPPYLPTKV